MVKPSEVLRYITENPGCNRPALFEHYAGGMKGEERRKIVLSISNALIILHRRGEISEDDISRKGKHIIDSKLTARGHDAAVGGEQHRLQSGLAHERGEGQAVRLRRSDLIILSLLNRAEKPLTAAEVSKQTGLHLRIATLRLQTLKTIGYVRQAIDGTWAPTLIGEMAAREEAPQQRPHPPSPDDNFFFNIPMLVDHAGESFSKDTIAQRAYGYQGFYEKYGLDDLQSQEDFVKKIGASLENEALRSNFIHQDRFLWSATPDEDQLFLWRLYAMLHTVLFKSTSKRKLGMAVWLYEPLLVLVKKTWGALLSKAETLRPEERFVLLLMANGVQMETILPKAAVPEFRARLEAIGIPIRVHNAGAENEYTLIETGAEQLGYEQAERARKG